jgi:hypothetical protein
MSRAAILLGSLFAAVMGANLVWAVFAIRKAEARKEEPHTEGTRRLSHDDAGNAVLAIDAETQKRTGLRTAPLEEAALAEEREAYGRLVEDPSRTFTLRSPIAGVLRRMGDLEWPSVGQELPQGTAVGRVEPRFTALDRIDLESRRSAAQADVDGGRAQVEAARAAYDRARTLNATDKYVADRTVEEAAAAFRAQEAKLKAAQETVAAIGSADPGREGPWPLVLGAAGEVVEVLAQPGEAVESGQALLRVARFDRVLARVSLAAGDAPDQQPDQARIAVLGQEEKVLLARRTGTGGTDPQLLGETWLFQVSGAGLRLRPGMALKAFLPLPGDAKKGVLVPRDAIVRAEGERWIYVQTAPDRFTRRELGPARPVEKGFFVAEGLHPGDPVVVSGAQMLLSEELKAKIASED